MAAARARLDAAGVDWRGAPIEGRYARVADIQQTVTTELAPPGETFSDKLDRVLTHKVWGTIIFVAIMALMFQSIFTFANVPMDLLKAGVNWVGGVVGSLIPAGRPAQSAGGRRDRGCRSGDRLPAADSAAVSVHRFS